MGTKVAAAVSKGVVEAIPVLARGALHVIKEAIPVMAKAVLVTAKAAAPAVNSVLASVLPVVVVGLGLVDVGLMIVKILKG